MIKKIVLADAFGEIADNFFSDPQGASTAIESWLGVYCFSMQIFFDFSGYTDMAIACGRFFGFHFPENFRRPYLATNITNFWRRWHISLSTWLRDYLYIPLGGNRHGTYKMYRNLMLTMLLGGLWHGASWNFIWWGGLHGIALVAHKVFLDLRPRLLSFKVISPVVKVLSAFLTFIFVMNCWVFFRADSFRDATTILANMWNLPSNFSEFNGDRIEWVLLVSVVILLIAVLQEKFDLLEKIHKGSAALNVIYLIICFFILEFFTINRIDIPFIYFQF